MNVKMVLACVGIAVFTHSSTAGTVTADSVYSDEVLTGVIGLLPSESSEILCYSFANDAGAAVEDDSGNGFGGVANGCVWSSGGPHVGGCMSFDGADDYIDAGSAPDFPAWAAYSVSIWFLHNGGGDFGPQYGHKMVDKTSFYHDWHLHLWPENGSIGLSMYENGVGFGMGDGSVNYMDNAWHHCVVVRDGNNGQFWVDGVLKASSENMFSVYSYSGVCVGNSFSEDGYQRMSWSGKLDEVRLFDRALTSTEVAQLFTEGVLPATAATGSAVVVATNLTVCGGLSVNGTVTAVGVCGDGSGLTNLTSASLAAGSVGTAALATGAVASGSLADGAVTSNKIAAGSVGIDKVVLSDLNAWGNGRYLSSTGSADLVLTSGRIVAGYGLNMSNIASTAYGASQRGYNTGRQAISGAAYGSSQSGSNMGTQTINSARGALQSGHNMGNQAIGSVAHGAAQHGINLGTMVIGNGAYGAVQRGYIAAGAWATNAGKGSVQLLNLTNSQKALITGYASIGMGACLVTNNQALVVGDGLVSRGNGTVAACGFFGDGSGLTNLNLAAYAGNNLTWDPVGNKLIATGVADSNAVAAILAGIPGLSDGDDDSRWSGAADGLDPAAGRAALGLGTAATQNVGAFAPADLSGYASETVTYSNGQFNAAAQVTPTQVAGAMQSVWPNLDTNAVDDLTTAGATMAGAFNMASNRVMNLAEPQADLDAVSRDYLRRVLSSLQPQGNLSMGGFTNGAPVSFPLTF